MRLVPFLELLLLGAVSLAEATPVVNWVATSGNTIFSKGSEATASPVITDADSDTIAANFPSVTLADGDSITLTGTVMFDVALTTTQFRIGLFDGPPVARGTAKPYKGIYTEAPTTFATSLKYGPGNKIHPFAAGTIIAKKFLPGSKNVAANTAIGFSLTITRDGTNLDVATSYSSKRGRYSTSATAQDVPIRKTAPRYNYTYNTAAFLLGGHLDAGKATFSDITVTTNKNKNTLAHDPTQKNPVKQEKIFGKRIIGIDFNRDDQFGAPSKSMCRIICGSATKQSANKLDYTKTIGPVQITIARPDNKKFEFCGAYHDPSRTVPGGNVSRAFLVSDFIGTRGGRIDITLTGLPAGDYVFRSFHLDPFIGSGLGFAQGATPTTRNTIEARIGGVTQASVQPTALSAAGLNTTSIDDSQIPTLVFPFTHDGSGPLTIRLLSLDSKGPNKFLFLNGFELFAKAAK